MRLDSMVATTIQEERKMIPIRGNNHIYLLNVPNPKYIFRHKQKGERTRLVRPITVIKGKRAFRAVARVLDQRLPLLVH